MQRTIFTETYDIKTPRVFIIGDPMYLEEVENGTANKAMKDFVLIKDKIPKVRKSKLIFKKDTHEEEGISWNSYTVKLIVCNAQFMDTYLQDKYYPDEVVREGYLGCDTARYDIYVDDRHQTIHTGADGMYGCLYDNKTVHGFNVEFDFTPDLFTEQEMRETLKYLFDCSDILNK